MKDYCHSVSTNVR